MGQRPAAHDLTPGNSPSSPGAIVSRARAAAAAILLAAIAGSSFAAEVAWPAQPIRIVVAQAPGGPPDLVARFVAEPLRRALGSSVVVENRPGAGGIVGVDLVSHAAADGYTLLLATLSTHALVPHANPHAQYDPVRDFAPVANLFRSVKALWVPASLPVATLPEFVRYAKARPGALNFATGGVGSSNHIDAALFASAAGLDLVHIPYNGPSAGVSAVAAGDAQMMIVSITTGLPLAQAGRVRALAVFAAARSPLMPDVPTAAEQGFAHLDLNAWMGLVAPAATPPSTIERLHAEIDAILAAPETLRWAREQGLEIARGTSSAFGRTIEADHERWGVVIRSMALRQP